MRRLAVSLILLVSVPGTLGRAGATPAEDVGAYCRARYGAMQQQVRCLYTERAAQERLGRRRPSVAAEAWARCHGGTASWTAMERCLARPALGGATPAARASRETPPISEAEAERQLRGVLERAGEPAARCTKKQYGPGWVTVCQ